MQTHITYYGAIYQTVQFSESLDSITADRYLACASSAAQVINSIRITGRCKRVADTLKTSDKKMVAHLAGWKQVMARSLQTPSKVFAAFRVAQIYELPTDLLVAAYPL